MSRGVASGEPQIAQRLGIDREEAAGRSVLRRHVGDRRAVGERQIGETRPAELDEAADDAVGAQHLGDGEDEVGGGDALAQDATEPHADDFR